MEDLTPNSTVATAGDASDRWWSKVIIEEKSSRGLNKEVDCACTMGRDDGAVF